MVSEVGRPAALAGIKVVEIANWVAGPSAAAIMADLGADVIKVEPLTGDGMRRKLRQATVADPATLTDHPFHLANRGKRSIAVDLVDPRGSALVRELIAGADVVVTNLLPSRLDRFQLGPDDVRRQNPRLVYALVTGYGSAGPDADRIAFDLTAFFGRGAIMSLIGEPGAPPPHFRPGQGDHSTGLALLSGILAALFMRERTGEGQVVETALMRTAAWTIGCDVSVALVDRTQPNRRSRTKPVSAFHNTYRCADGVWLNLQSQDIALWPKFCDAIGRADLGADERYATWETRLHNAAELVAILDAEFASRPFAEWVPRLDASGIAWSKVAQLPDLVDDPQARENGMFVAVDHPTAGRFETLAAPFTLSLAPPTVRTCGPEIGEHTAEVLAGLGLAEEEIADLLQAGVVRAPSIEPA
ncbi:MAG: CaiB/BaiF CoA transferase family protein [Acidimicrobiales bacterium]